MSYSKTTWSTGDTITAAKMNKIEQGVYDAHNSSGSGGITTETDPTVPSWAKQSSKPTYTASEVGALPSSTEIHNVPSGGTTGQVLTKNSNNNYDLKWSTPSSGSGSGSSEQYVDYDAVVSIYQPNASADPTINIIKGNYSIITAKLNSGTTAPAILILYKDERSDRYVTRPGEIWYYSPNATPPFFNVSLYVTRTYYSLSSSSGADVRTVTIHWPNTNIITPW